MAQSGDQAGALGALDEVLTGYINEALLTMMDEGVITTQQVTVTDGGTAPLNREILEVVSLTDAQGREKEYTLTSQGIEVTPDGTYTARFRLTPPPLSDAQDEPQMPQSFQGALADYATWRLLSNGGRAQQLRAETYRLCFEQKAEQYRRMRDGMKRVNRRRNQYN